MKLKIGASSLVGPSSSASSSSTAVKDASSSSSGAVVYGVKKGDSSSSIAKKSGSSSGARKGVKPAVVADASDLSDSDVGSCSGPDDNDGDDDDVTVLSSGSGSGHRDSLNSLFNDVSNEVSLVVECWIVLSGAVTLALWLWCGGDVIFAAYLFGLFLSTDVVVLMCDLSGSLPHLSGAVVMPASAFILSQDVLTLGLF